VSWTEEPTATEMLVVLALAERMSKLKRLRLIKVDMVANLLPGRVIPLKKRIHPSWEYNGIQDPSCETDHHILIVQLERLLEEMLQSMDSWPTPDQVPTFHIERARDLVSRLNQSSILKFGT
jgi:hypothetical protein